MVSSFWGCKRNKAGPAARGTSYWTFRNTALFFDRLEFLVGQYSELSKKSKAKFPLHDAIVSSKTSLVGKLLKDEKTPVDSLCNGFSPLGFATAVGNTEVTKLLLEKGADLNLKDDKYGLSPLIHAVMGNFPEIVRLLLKAGAKIDICSSQGDSTLKESN